MHMRKHSQENLRQVAFRATELRNLRRDVFEDFSLRAAAAAVAAAGGALLSQKECTVYIVSIFSRV
jgi:hypothetical protein